MRTQLLFCFAFFVLGLTLLSNKTFAQKPVILYSPATNVLTLNTAFTLSPTNSGGAVASFAFGAGTKLTGTLINPYGMAVDGSDNIYVTNYGGTTVSKYNSSGTQSTFISSAAQLTQPIGIAFDASGNAYVLSYNKINNGNGNNYANGYVSQYNSAGTFQSKIIQGLGTAYGITIDASGNLYVAEAGGNKGNNTVAQYNTSGVLSFSLTNTYLANPVGVATDGAGNIYVLDNTNQNVTEYNSTGTYLSTPITGLNTPWAIYIDDAGYIYIGDSGTGTVTVYNSTGTVLTSITGLTDPRGIVTDSKGNLYVSDYTKNTVTKYPLTGGDNLSGVLPAGLSFDNGTGVFNGTVTSPFTATNFSITAYNASGNSTFSPVTLSCPPNASAPSISYIPSINVFTIGTAVTLSPTNSAGTPTSYAISPTTLPTGLTFSTSTGAISGTPSVSATAALYTVTATNSSGSSSATISIACVIDDYWTGSKSTLWTAKQNWSTNNVPTTGDLASIGVIDYTSGNNPIIPANAAVSADYVTFGATRAAILGVQDGATFTVNKILTVNNNATPTIKVAAGYTGTGVVNVASAAVININGTGLLTLSSPLIFTLKSDATGSASVSEITTGSITGTVKVQRYISAERGYRLLSSPVYAGAAGGNNIYSLNYLSTNLYLTGTGDVAGGFTAKGNPTLFLYDEGFVPQFTTFLNSNFIGISNISSGTGTTPSYLMNINGSISPIVSTTTGYNIPVGNAYYCFFRGNLTEGATNLTNPAYSSVVAATVTASGTLNQGQITFKDWYNPTSTSLGSSSQHFNLIGNPYASAIDLGTIPTATTTSGIYATPYNNGTSTGISKFIYELNPATGIYGVYTDDNSLPATNGASEYIASGQGFFVTAFGSACQLIFNENGKAGSTNGNATGLMARRINNLSAINPGRANPILHLKMSLDSINNEETIITFNPNSKTSYVINEDAPHHTGNGLVGLSSISADNVLMAINSMPLQQTQTIPLKVYAANNGIYKIDLSQPSPLPALYDVWLKDAYAKDSLDIKHNPEYSFNIITADTGTFGTNRFSLVVRQNPALMVHLLSFGAAKAPVGDQVTWVTENEATYTDFTVERSIDGGATFNDLDGFPSSAQGTYSYLDKTPANGINMYRLKITDLNGKASYSNVVTIMYANTNGKIAINGLMVYPNPTANTINLSITGNQANGTAMAATTTTRPAYNIEIVNNMGSVIKSAKSSSPLWQSDVTALTPGTYFIRVIDTGNNTVVGKSTFVKL